MVDSDDKDKDPLTNLITGKVAVIFGPADIRDTAVLEYAVKIAAGSGLPNMLAVGIRPDIIVTDLDGDIELLSELNEKGAVIVVQAHGDNIDIMKVVVPKFIGPVLGTTQVEEVRGLMNFGGYTDGDRAVFLAMYHGAKEVILKGFDFDKPVEKAGANPEVKLKKLVYAKELIEYASDHFSVEVIQD